MIKTLVLSALVAVAFAECPGDGSPCSGHGSCGPWDKCQCYRNWQGPSCSDRTCPFQTSWNFIEGVSATGWDTDITVYEHGYTECSSKGECNRKTGECECFDGFTGSACRRMMCDGDGHCNGHGVCKTLETITSGYTGWDSQKIQICECDPGFEGDGCEKRICPHGDDPITTSSLVDGAYNTQVDDTQVIDITVTASANKQFLIEYTDYRGMKWQTYPIDAVAPTAIEVKEALEALPNNAVPHVDVVVDITSGVGNIEITFSHHSNSGQQALINILEAGCSAEGCQPKYEGTDWTASVDHKDLGDGESYEEFYSCSKRGTCDTETGDCQCFKGYTGQACELQTIIV